MDSIYTSQYKSDFSLVDEYGYSIMSKEYTKAYLHHLFKTEEILGYRIATHLNLYFYIQNLKKSFIIFAINKS